MKPGFADYVLPMGHGSERQHYSYETHDAQASGFASL
jgi:hypothetical protein